jgi:hypothetical protein
MYKYKIVFMHIWLSAQIFHKVQKLHHFMAMQWLRRLVASLSPRRPRFTPGPLHVGFVVDKVALG